MYDEFVKIMRQAHDPEKVKDGVFGAMMEVALVNDGPVTFDYDTAKSGTVSEQKEKDEKKKKWEERKATGKKAQRTEQGKAENQDLDKSVLLDIDGMDGKPTAMATATHTVVETSTQTLDPK